MSKQEIEKLHVKKQRMFKNKEYGKLCQKKRKIEKTALKKEKKNKENRKLWQTKNKDLIEMNRE